MMRSPRRLISLICFLMSLPELHAQQAAPRVRYFAPEEYGGGWQVFDVAQDHHGRIYAVVPDDNALYCFDGANWEHIPTPWSPLTVQTDCLGRICIGHEAGLARLKRDDAGQPVVTPVDLAFLPDDSHSIGIHVRDAAPSGFNLTFSNSRLVIDVSSEASRIWRTRFEEKFVGRVHGRNYVTRRGEPGVYVVDGEDRVPLPALSETSVCWVIECPGHEMMVMTAEDVLVLDGGQTRLFSEQLAAAMPEFSSIYWCWPNRDGTISVGTTTGFYCCSADGRLLYTVDKSSGLESNVVLSAFQDRSGDLWLSTEVGLAHVAHAARENVFTFRNPERRMTDFLYAQESSVLVGRRGEAYCIEIPSMKRTLIPQLKEQLIVGAAEHRGELFVASSDMVSRIEGKSATSVYTGQATSFAFHPEQEFAAVALLDSVVEIASPQQGSDWGSVQSIPIQSHLAEMRVAQNGDIIGISYDGKTITRIRFEGDWSTPAVVTYFKTPAAQLLQNEGFVLIVSSNGWQDYDPEIEHGLPFVTAKCLRGIDYRCADMATFTGNADLLVAGDRQVLRYPLDRTSGEYRAQWDRKVLVEADLVCEPVEVNGWFCVAHTQGLTIFRDGVTDFQEAVQPVISLSGDAFQSRDGTPTAMSGSSARFNFATPLFAADRLMEYQCRLLPSQNDWSKWSEQTTIEYADLSPGQKTFQVRARIRGRDFVSSHQVVFDVTPFWYETTVARVCGVVSALLLLSGLIYIRERKTVVANQRLEAEVDSRTALLGEANLKLEEKMRLAAEAEKARAALAERYQESERLESLGSMAGGIAHDFNNLLAVIVMQSELLRMGNGGANAELDASIDVIESTADTAAQLCRQMLAASCSSPLENELISLHDLVRELHPLLRSSVTPHPLELKLELSCDQFCGDASQIKQAILNLAVNAREAQKNDRELLIIETGQSVLSHHELQHLRCIGELPEPGEYVWVSVSDPGPGLEQETQRRMFDPFYSTKAPGRGLGMATVLQTSSRHGGGVTLTRADGRTQFRVYLPVNHAVVPMRCSDAAPELPRPATTDGMKVLLVDDEPSVRESASLLLEERDFRVVSAATGEEGLKLFHENQTEIDLAILDISLPGINGQEVATQMLNAVPGLPIVMMSGFSGETIAEDFAARPTVTFLKKPFRSQGLYTACSAVTSSRTG